MRVQESTPQFGHSRRSYLIGLEEAPDDEIIFAFRLGRSGNSNAPRLLRVTILDNVFGGELILNMAADAGKLPHFHCQVLRNH